MTRPGAAGPAGGDGPDAWLRAGSAVLIVPLQLTGTVAAVNGGEYAVAVGELRVFCAAADLAPAAPEPAGGGPAGRRAEASRTGPGRSPDRPGTIG